MSDRPAHLLVVCTANQCRSVIAESIFRHSLASTPWLAWEVDSAGTRALEDRPIHPLAHDVLIAAGVPVGELRSCSLSKELIGRADVVLTAERSHRSEVVALLPDALHRTFTLRQFARLLLAGVPTEPDPPCGRSVAELVDLAQRARSRSEPGDDDIADPIGGPRRDFELTMARIGAAVASIIDVAAAGIDGAGRTLRSSANLPTT